MPVFSVNDPDDQRLEPYSALPRRSRKQAAHANEPPPEAFVVEGTWLVERLARSDLELTSILTGTNQTSKAVEIASSIDSLDKLPIYSMPLATISQLVGFPFHRGMLACARRPPTPTLESLLAGVASEKKIIVVCPRINDETNLGGILRAGAAFGVAGFLLGAEGADPYARRTLRLSMGAAFSIPIRVTEQISTDLKWLQTQRECELIATVLSDQAQPATTLGDGLLATANNIGLLLGTEDFGIPEEIVTQCDHQVTIPMRGGTDSLNVAMAAGILLHELRRAELRSDCMLE